RRESHMSARVRRLRFVVPMLVALVLAAVMAVSAAAARQPRGPHAAGVYDKAGSSQIRFSHGVPTDQQRPGFEPDVAFDPTPVTPGGADRIYSSVPFGFSTTESFIWASRDSGKTYQLAPGNVGPG